MTKQETFEYFAEMFKSQLGLDLSDVVTVDDGKYVLHMEMMALSIGSLKLKMSPNDHSKMAEFLDDVMSDR